MGKARIISETGAGQYQIAILKDTGLSDMEALTARITTTAADIVAALATLTTAQDAQQQAFTELQSAIESNNNEVADTKLRAYQAAETTTNRAEYNYRKLRLLALALDKQQAAITVALAESSARSAWCVDISEGLTGEVGTIEINGVDDQILLTAAGATGLGALQPTKASSPAGVAFNLMIHPWWQKYKPTFRVGTITSINTSANTCAVDLAEATAAKQMDIVGDPIPGPSINQSSTLTGVTFDYMTCDHEAFKVGDSVVIQFVDQDWSQPKVIGFADHPQPCAFSVPIQFFDPAGVAAFSALADARIAELNTLKDHADYCKNTFIPALLNYYDTFLDKIYGWTSPVQE